jgi:hypothetical protein
MLVKWDELAEIELLGRWCGCMATASANGGQQFFNVSGGLKPLNRLHHSGKTALNTSS